MLQELSKELYGAVLLERYNVARERYQSLPIRVPNIVIESVRKQVKIKPESNLRESLNALDRGIAEYINSSEK